MAYLLGYRIKPQYRDRHDRPVDDVFDVQFSPEPEWNMQDSHLADAECRLANNMRVHVGPHYCNFDVEEYEPGNFAIRCTSHPNPLRK